MVFTAFSLQTPQVLFLLFDSFKIIADLFIIVDVYMVIECIFSEVWYIYSVKRLGYTMYLLILPSYYHLFPAFFPSSCYKNELKVHDNKDNRNRNRNKISYL